jgi:hypothetical protein
MSQKLNLLFPREGLPGKHYWVVSKEDDLVDEPFTVIASETMSESGVKYTRREGAMTSIYVPDKMQDYMLIEIVMPTRDAVLKELRKRRIIKKVKPKEVSKSGLDFI